MREACGYDHGKQWKSLVRSSGVVGEKDPSSSSNNCAKHESSGFCATERTLSLSEATLNGSTCITTTPTTRRPLGLALLQDSSHGGTARRGRSFVVGESKKSSQQQQQQPSRRRALLDTSSFVVRSGMLDPTQDETEEEEEENRRIASRRSMFEDRQLSVFKSKTKKDMDDNDSSSSSGSSSSSEGPPAKKKSNNPFLGAPYTRLEYTYAICVGVLLSFNAGYVNGSCLSGLVAPSGTQRAVTSHTGTTSKSALALSSGETSEFGFLTSMLLCFALGSFVAGSLTPKPKAAFQIEASYGPTFLIGAALLTSSSCLAAMEVQQEQFIFYLASAANGIQNGISSIYSKNLIRSTGVTGTTTDIGIFLGQLIRGNRMNTWKLIVLLCLWTSFWMGGLVSLFATSKFLHFSLLYNAGLFLLIGGSVVTFLHQELDVSWSHALLGKDIAFPMPTQEQQEEKEEEEEERRTTYCGDGISLATTAAASNHNPDRPWWADIPTDFEC